MTFLSYLPCLHGDLVRPCVRPSVGPSVHPSTFTLGVLWAQFLLQFCTDHFETLHVFSQWYEDVHEVWIWLLDYFLSLFPHCELSHFSPSICRQWVPLVSASPLTVLYWLFWNFACVFFRVWRCACGLGIIVRTFWSHFPHCERSRFHPHYTDSGYLLWAQLLLQFCTDRFETLHMFSSCMRMRMWFGYNCVIIFVAFSTL